MPRFTPVRQLSVFAAACAVAVVAAALPAAHAAVTVINSLTAFEALYPGADGSWPPVSNATDGGGHSPSDVNKLEAFSSRGITVSNTG